MKRYVLGFAFDKQLNVILVRKNKPDWQAGFLNGVGGQIEERDKFPIDAMVREFEEETFLLTHRDNWKFICKMQSPKFEVYTYSMFSIHDNYKPYHLQKTDTNEHLEIIHVSELTQHPTISNIPWLIGMCFDHQMPLNTYYLSFEEYE